MLRQLVRAYPLTCWYACSVAVALLAVKAGRCW